MIAMAVGTAIAVITLVYVLYPLLNEDTKKQKTGMGD